MERRPVGRTEVIRRRTRRARTQEARAELRSARASHWTSWEVMQEDWVRPHQPSWVPTPEQGSAANSEAWRGHRLSTPGTRSATAGVRRRIDWNDHGWAGLAGSTGLSVAEPSGADEHGKEDGGGEFEDQPTGWVEGFSGRRAATDRGALMAYPGMRCATVAVVAVPDHPNLPNRPRGREVRCLFDHFRRVRRSAGTCTSATLCRTTCAHTGRMSGHSGVRRSVSAGAGVG